MSERNEVDPFEALLAKAEAEVPPGQRGFFAPESLSWRINRESVLHLGGMRAALMQMAHPKVAQGVADFSNFKEDTLGRFVRTFDAVYGILFGTRARALAAARRVHTIHTIIHGELPEVIGHHSKGAVYSALDPLLLRWVWATLIDSAIDAYERFFRPMSPLEREVYYRESWLFAKLFGVSEEHIPRTHELFSKWMKSMLASSELGVGTAGREICTALVKGPGRLRYAAPILRMLAAAGLPPRIRDMFGLHLRASDRAIYAMLSRTMRAVAPRLPESMRAIPQAQEAEAALVGMKPPRNLQNVFLRGVGIRMATEVG